MKRLAFFGLLSGFVLEAAKPAMAAHSVVVVVSSNADSQDEQLENFFAGALRDHGIAVIDPSSIEITYHERARLLASRTAEGATFDYSAAAWIETRYHSERALFCSVHFSSTSLPYGEFTVTSMRAAASYRCFDIAEKRLLSAGTYTAMSRGEDEGAAQQKAAEDALRGLSRKAAATLS